MVRRMMMMSTADLIDVRVVCNLHPHQPPQSHCSTGQRLHLQRPARETADYPGGEQVPAGRLGCVWGCHPTKGLIGRGGVFVEGQKTAHDRTTRKASRLRQGGDVAEELRSSRDGLKKARYMYMVKVKVNEHEGRPAVRQTTARAFTCSSHSASLWGLLRSSSLASNQSLDNSS